MRSRSSWVRAFLAAVVIVGLSATPFLVAVTPASADFRPTPPLGDFTYRSAVATLADGRVLVAGGRNLDSPMGITQDAWLYDPWANTWTAAPPMANERYGADATTLPDGKVLVCAGGGGGALDNDCERYDPAKDVWLSTRLMGFKCTDGAAATLSNGKALVFDCLNGVSEPYDPATNRWGSLAYHTAYRNYGAGWNTLGDGRLFVVGGNPSVAYAETYDPLTNVWTKTTNGSSAREYTTATLLANGKELVVGGQTGAGTVLNTVQIYDPSSNSWSNAAPMLKARYSHAATLLPNGDVLVTGGIGSAGSPLSSAEIYDPTTDAWTVAPSLVDSRAGHSAVALGDGGTLVVGGYDATNSLPDPEVYQLPTATWSAVGSLATARINHTATLLPAGQVLVAGGYTGTDTLASAELFDPGAKTWSSAGDMLNPHRNATATLLQNGKVLIAGGNDLGGSTTQADLYNPTTNSWTGAGTTGSLRAVPTATLLGDGRVLVAGGSDGTNVLSSTELYSPSTNSWSLGAAMSSPRIAATSVRLGDGRVLMTGGSDGTFDLASAEIYDPVANTWTPVTPMNTPMEGAQTVTLRDGRVLVAGGQRYATLLNYGEVYDPVANAWTDTGAYDIGRALDGLVIDPTGSQPALIGGQATGGGALTSVELYDAPTNQWWDGAELSTPLVGATATVLSSGRIIFAGGSPGSSPTGITQESPPNSSISITNAGFGPAGKGLGEMPGEARWSDTEGSHSVVDTAKLGPPDGLGMATPLFSSGTLGAGQTYEYTFVAAGTYHYRSSVGTAFTGAIKVPDLAFLMSNPGARRIYVAFATGRMPGYGFNASYRFKPSGGSFGAWTAWPPPGASVWTGAHGIFTGAAIGTYQFRSQLTNPTTGRASGYSPPVSVTVP